MTEIPSSEITPEKLYYSRREFIAAAGAIAAGAWLSGCGITSPTVPPATPMMAMPAEGQQTLQSDELGNPLTPFNRITTYNNYYEFSYDKIGVDTLAKNLRISPWNVQVGGLVNKPRTFGLEDILKLATEERIYRLRCVETWSMVVPWTGLPLSRLLALVEPQSNAKYVRFETLLDPKQMPGQNDGSLKWPYVEGLRLDEAMHDFTLLATGLYGKPLLPQDGAPVRLVVPWKYGFKYCKAIVKIDLVEEMPVSFWMRYSPDEYGFYANVNPQVAHPRWSQATERRIGETERRETLMFNGYADQVAALYQGMDMRVYH